MSKMSVSEYRLILAPETLHPVLLYDNNGVINAAERIRILEYALAELYRTEKPTNHNNAIVLQAVPSYETELE